MKISSLLCTLFFSLSSFGQTIKPHGGENIALAKSSINLNNQWSIYHCPANMIIQDSKWSIGVAYSNYYFLKELNFISISSQFQLKKGRIGLGLSNFGWGTYSESLFALSYALELFDGFSLGASIQYHLIRFSPDETITHGCTGLIGLKYRYKSNFSISLNIENPFALNWSGSKEKLPVGFSLGLLLKFKANLQVHLSSEMYLNQSLKLSVGIDYKVKNKLKPLLGFSILPLGIGAGIWCQLKRFQFSVGFLYLSGFSSISAIDFMYEK